jgi:DNA-binding HxlR family transcriptional regulator
MPPSLADIREATGNELSARRADANAGTFRTASGDRANGGRANGGRACGISLSGVQPTLSAIEGHWKLPILFRLLDGTRRFGELRKHLPAATQRMLTLHLRELERDGLIHREIYREVPPKVEYSLTEMGRSLEPLLRFMSEWGHANRGALVAAVESLARAPADAALAGSAASPMRVASPPPGLWPRNPRLFAR